MAIITGGKVVRRLLEHQATWE